MLCFANQWGSPRIEVDIIRDWNLDQPDTWGAVGHFSIASRIVNALSGTYPKLGQLMKNNLENH